MSSSMEIDMETATKQESKKQDTESGTTNGDCSTSSQPDSPLSSCDLSSKTSTHNSDTEAPVLTPMNGDVESECKKRKAEVELPETSGGDLQLETKKPKLDESSTLEKTKDTTENSNDDVNDIDDSDKPLDISMKPTSKVSDASKDSVAISEVSESKETTNAKGTSSDSDKENVDAPIDLSVGIKSNGGSDVASLSDEEEATKPRVNGGFKEHLTPEQTKERRRLIKRLQDELRNEEAKLVLLKKIRQSQMMQHIKEPMASNSSKTGPPAASSGRPSQGGPPPLVNNKTSQPNLSHNQHYAGSSQPPQLNRVMPNSHSQNRTMLQPGSQRSSQNQGPPPLVMAPTSRGHSQSTQRSHQSSSHHMQSSRNSPQVNQPPSQPEQTPAQRQAAAKLALRKQLEKTLLQIPPPKPPPPEMNFIPSLAGNDFMVLVGLEEVVKFIVDIDAQSKGEKGPEVKYVFNPFVCVQCGTDFTPVWKRDKPGSKNVICEQCVTSNQKKALKQEHTNRLKSAFVKALQQEQEIEQRMQAQSSSSSSSATSHHRERDRSDRSDRDRSERDRSDRDRGDRDRERSERSDRGERESHRERDHSSHRDHETEQRSSRPSHGHSSSRGSSHGSSHSSSHGSSHHDLSSSGNPVNLSTNFKATNEQIRQHQNLLQAHQAQLRGAAALAGLSSFNPRLMFPFSPQHMPSSSNKDLQRQDLQRQYLLDMIPRSLPGGNVLWRT